MMDSTATHAGRRPTKFMVELSRAMQGAVETSRDETLARFGADAKAAVEEIHAASTVEAADPPPPSRRRRRRGSRMVEGRDRPDPRGDRGPDRRPQDRARHRDRRAREGRRGRVSPSSARPCRTSKPRWPPTSSACSPSRTRPGSRRWPSPCRSRPTSPTWPPRSPSRPPSGSRSSRAPAVETDVPRRRASESASRPRATEETAEAAAPELAFAAAEEEAAAFSGEPEDDASGLDDRDRPSRRRDTTEPAAEAETSARTAARPTPSRRRGTPRTPPARRACDDPRDRPWPRQRRQHRHLQAQPRAASRVSRPSACRLAPTASSSSPSATTRASAWATRSPRCPGSTPASRPRSDDGLEVAAHDPDAGD